MNEREDTYDVGVIVGRFQVPALHQGHIDLIDYVLARHKKSLILLGKSETVNTVQNPLDFEARYIMLQEHYPGITIGYLKDMKSDEAWSVQLDCRVRDFLSPSQTAVLYGGRDSFIPYYSGIYPVKELVQDGHLSGTEIREQCRQMVRASDDFRAGVIWASSNRFPNTFPCVDIAIFDDQDRLLLGKKTDEEYWRFIGGFAEPSSENYEEDAIREAEEETGLTIIPSSLEYIGSFKVDDWRYRNDPDKIRTILFAGTTANPVIAKAADDITEIQWFDRWEDLCELDITPEHQPLLRSLKEHYFLRSLKGHYY